MLLAVICLLRSHVTLVIELHRQWLYGVSRFCSLKGILSREASPLIPLSWFPSCSSEKAKMTLHSLLPILSWLPSYPVREYLFGDLVSGLSTGVMQLPQGQSVWILVIQGMVSLFQPMRSNVKQSTALAVCTVYMQIISKFSKKLCSTKHFAFYLGWPVCFLKFSSLQKGPCEWFLAECQYSLVTVVAGKHDIMENQGSPLSRSAACWDFGLKLAEQILEAAFYV